MEIVDKPWGFENLFTFNELSTVKIINLKPNSILSLQYHLKREEMWYFLTDGYIQLGKKKRKVKKGSFIKIKKKKLHRLFSKDKEVKVLEVSLGTFDWNDIYRLEDNYGRKGVKGK